MALSSPNVIPGDTIYLHGGTYTGNFTCSVSGTEALPITVQAYPGETVIIDGGLTVTGDYVTVVGM